MRYKKGNLFLICLIASVLLTACGGSAKSTEKTATSASKEDKTVSSVSVDTNNSDLLGVMSEIKKEEGLEGEFIVEPAASDENIIVSEEEADKVTFAITFNVDKNLDSRLDYSYTVNEDGSLSLCSLPTNMNIILKPYVGRYLDLTQTDVIEKQELKGFLGTILYPKRSTLSNAPQKVLHHKGRQMVHSKPRIME